MLSSFAERNRSPAWAAPTPIVGRKRNAAPVGVERLALGEHDSTKNYLDPLLGMPETTRSTKASKQHAVFDGVDTAI